MAVAKRGERFIDVISELSNQALLLFTLSTANLIY